MWLNVNNKFKSNSQCRILRKISPFQYFLIIWTNILNSFSIFFACKNYVYFISFEIVKIIIFCCIFILKIRLNFRNSGKCHLRLSNSRCTHKFKKNLCNFPVNYYNHMPIVFNSKYILRKKISKIDKFINQIVFLSGMFNDNVLI